MMSLLPLTCLLQQASVIIIILFSSSSLLLWSSPSSRLVVDALSMSTTSSSSSLPPSIMTGKQKKRAVITGMGLTSCLGNTLEEVQDSLYKGKSGIQFQPEIAELGYGSQVRGLPNLSADDIKELIPKQTLRFCGRNAQYAYIAMKRAIEDSGLAPEQYEGNERACCFVGQGGPSAPDIMETTEAVLSGGKRWKNKVGPFRVPRVMTSACSAVLATSFKVQGPSFCVTSACSSSGHCMGTGYQQILLGKADLAFCGAGQDAGWEFMAAYDSMGALSSAYNDSPETASRAFDKTRDGFVLAGGGGIVVLEELEHALKRGAKIYGELTGYAANADGFDMVRPSGDGAVRCMKLAMAEANEAAATRNGSSGSSDDVVIPIDYINTHGTSTPVGDPAELEAIHAVFDEQHQHQQDYMPAVGSTKSLSGHALSAAGVHETIYTLLMMQHDFMAKSANIHNLMDEATGLDILLDRRDQPFRRAMSNSFGFGGTNCCLVFDKYDDES